MHCHLVCTNDGQRLKWATKSLTLRHYWRERILPNLQFHVSVSAVSATSNDHRPTPAETEMRPRQSGHNLHSESDVNRLYAGSSWQDTCQPVCCACAMTSYSSDLDIRMHYFMTRPRNWGHSVHKTITCNNPVHVRWKLIKLNVSATRNDQRCNSLRYGVSLLVLKPRPAPHVHSCNLIPLRNIRSRPDWLQLTHWWPCLLLATSIERSMH